MTTKKEKQIAALRQRLFDMACGALGGVYDEADDMSMMGIFDAEGLQRFMEAIKWTWLGGSEHQWRIGIHCVGRFTDLDSVSEWLQEELEGVARVDKQKKAEVSR